MLLAIDLHEDLINEEGVAVASVPSLQTACINSSELNAPEADGFATNDDYPFGRQILDISMAEIESIVEPDGVRNDIWGESVSLISIHEPSLAILAR